MARREFSNRRGPRLQVLEEYIKMGKKSLGCSKFQMKKWAGEIGLCLLNFKPYGDRLRTFLRKNPNMIVPLRKAKDYEFVKLFLIKL